MVYIEHLIFLRIWNLGTCQAEATYVTPIKTLITESARASQVDNVPYWLSIPLLERQGSIRFYKYSGKPVPVFPQSFSGVPFLFATFVLYVFAVVSHSYV